jgi:hypothetical protein
MSHHVGNVSTQDIAALRGVLRKHTEEAGPTPESIANEIKAVLTTMVRHADKDLKVGTVRPNPAPEDKFTALLKHIMQELQQILNGSKEQFMNGGNEPGDAPHHPPPQGPHGHGLPPVFKGLQAAATKLASAEEELRSAKKAEDKMEIELYGHTIPAESVDTKNARKGVTSAEAGILKALLQMVERLAGQGHGPIHTMEDKHGNKPSSIEELMNGLMQKMQDFTGPAAKAKVGDTRSPAAHDATDFGVRPSLPPAFKEFAKAFGKLEAAEHKLQAAQAKEDKLETKLYGAPVSAESVATTHAKEDVANAKAAVIAALKHILASFDAPATDPIEDPIEGGDGSVDEPGYVGTDPVEEDPIEGWDDSADEPVYVETGRVTTTVHHSQVEAQRA